jgi:xeroderma pigmentosum group C-complementing protein
MLSKHTVMCLNPKENLPQYTRSTTFVDGLRQASETFKRRFKITARGMKRSYWLEAEDLQSSTVCLPLFPL